MEIGGGKHGQDMQEEAGRVGLVAQGGPAPSSPQLQRSCQRVTQHARRRHQAAPTPHRHGSSPTTAVPRRRCRRAQQRRLLLLLLMLWRHGLPLVTVRRSRL
jgi:hypothetical protein